MTRVAPAVGLARLLGLALLMGLAACGDEAAAPDTKAYLGEGDAAFERGEARAVAARPDGSGHVDLDARAEAVAAWSDAATAYRNAFRLIDPDPAAARSRGMLAFRAARALAKAGLAGTDPAWAGLHADLALTWFAQAERLVPDLRQVDYERARLYDSGIASVADRVRAHAAYARYLAQVGAAGAVSAGEQTRVDHARERVAALAPVVGVVPRGMPKDG